MAMTPLADDLFPRWAHVPGRTTSADRVRLDRALAVLADDDEKLGYGLDLLRRSFAWEAHEILEDLWKRATPNSRERDGLRILIQIANAGLKETMHRPAAATRLWREAAAALRTLLATGRPACLGLNFAEVAAFVEDRERANRTPPTNNAIKCMFCMKSPRQRGA